MTTTLPDVLSRVRAAVESCGWAMLERPETAPSGSLPPGEADQSAEWAQDRFTFALDGPELPAPDYYASAEEMREQLLTLRLFDRLAGDPAAEDPLLVQEAQEVSAAIERWATYPAGTDLVLCRGIRVERDPEEPTWATALVGLRLRYAVPYGS